MSGRSESVSQEAPRCTARSAPVEHHTRRRKTRYGFAMHQHLRVRRCQRVSASNEPSSVRIRTAAWARQRDGGLVRPHVQQLDMGTAYPLVRSSERGEARGGGVGGQVCVRSVPYAVSVPTVHVPCSPARPPYLSRLFIAWHRYTLLSESLTLSVCQRTR